MQKQKNSLGFTAVEAVIILLVVSLLGLAIWYFVHAKAQTNDGIEQAKNVSKIEVPKTREEELVQYTNAEYGFSFSYPKNWQITEELNNQGRGQKEGVITVTSPKGTNVYFKPNLGGKGGDCWDEAANARTKNTCSNLARFSVEQLPAGTGGQQVYFVTGSLTAPLRDGGEARFFVGLETATDTPQTGEELTAAYGGILTSPKLGYVDVSVDGEDDYKATSEAYFETDQAKEATLVLKSFRFNK